MAGRSTVDKATYVMIASDGFVVQYFVDCLFLWLYWRWLALRHNAVTRAVLLENLRNDSCSHCICHQAVWFWYQQKLEAKQACCIVLALCPGLAALVWVWPSAEESLIYTPLLAFMAHTRTFTVPYQTLLVACIDRKRMQPVKILIRCFPGEHVGFEVTCGGHEEAKTRCVSGCDLYCSMP